MAPLPENNTARLYIDYTSRGTPHTLLLRFPTEDIISDHIAMAEGLIEELRPFMLTTDSFTGLRTSARLSNLAFPVAFLPVGGTSVVTSDEVDPESFFFSWAGRGGVTGRRYVPKFYGTRGLQSRPADNRYSGGESTPIALLRAYWVSMTTDPDPQVRIVTIGNDIPVFNGYTNVANSSYWQRKQRG